jgi:putative transposase
VTAHPDGPWTTQQIRNMLTDPGDRAADFPFLVRDRARQFTDSFDAALASTGIQAVKIPQALARTLCRTVRAHRPDRGHRPDADPRKATPATGPDPVPGHYNRRRPHRSRQLRPLRPDHPAADLSREQIRRRPVLGGLINEYERAA